MLADLASCSPRRAIAVPASSAPTLPSPLPVSSTASLSSCSLTADRWPNFRCLHPPFSLHYCSVCYLFHILVDNFDPCSIQPPLLLCASCSSVVLASQGHCCARFIGPHSPVSSACLLPCLSVFMLAYCRSLAKFPMPPSAFQPALLLSLLSVSHPG